MMRMAALLQNGTQCLLLASDFLFDELAPPTKLLLEDAGAGEPGKRDPSGKNGMIALDGPVVALERIGRCGATFRGSLEDSALRTGSRFAARRLANEPG